MQNKENGFGRFVKEKGYYIVLLLCAVAIGVSGYLLLSGKNSDQQVHLSTERATVPPGVPGPTEHAENVVATDGPEPGHGGYGADAAPAAAGGGRADGRLCGGPSGLQCDDARLAHARGPRSGRGTRRSGLRRGRRDCLHDL